MSGFRISVEAIKMKSVVVFIKQYNFHAVAVRLIFISFSFLACVNAMAEKERPNIVLILADDMGYSDLSSYGGEIATPNIDALADQGMKFTNFHVGSSCSPTRSMLLTGMDNHLVGLGNMHEIIADGQRGKAGYEGYLNDGALTVATLLKDAGYHTYMSGKWHLGQRAASRPQQQGFERSIAIHSSGGDNWEHKNYVPFVTSLMVTEDDQEIRLPEAFYSSDYYTDKLMEYIESNRGDGKPFFGYLSYQAVHYPHHAPKSSTDKYMDTYQVGWEVIRQRRYQRLVDMNLMPQGLTLKKSSFYAPWDDLNTEEKRYSAKQMAVYAGMVDRMDINVGRLMAYLKRIGEYENTVLMFLSDNGADANDMTDSFGAYYHWAFDLSYEQLGLKGSYSNYGPNWQQASASPFSYHKATSAEGGIRVPMIVRIPNGVSGKVSHAFGYVKTIVPTILDLVGMEPPEGTYVSKKIHTIEARSMLPLLRGESDRVYSEEDYIAYELSGNAAVFQGDYKLVSNFEPVGNRQWELYNLSQDPVEMHDLAREMPGRVEAMAAAYDLYMQEHNAVLVDDDYDVITQIKKTLLRYGWEKMKSIFTFSS